MSSINELDATCVHVQPMLCQHAHIMVAINSCILHIYFKDQKDHEALHPYMHRF